MNRLDVLNILMDLLPRKTRDVLKLFFILFYLIFPVQSSFLIKHLFLASVAILQNDLMKIIDPIILNN